MEVIIVFLLSLGWSIIKGVFLILATYYVYSFLIDCIEGVWETIHPNSLKWVKSKFRRKSSAHICLNCGGRGYVEYETGVAHDGYKEIMKEPCDCYLEDSKK